MGYPVIEATATSGSNTGTTSHVVTLPGSIVAGELLLVIVTVSGNCDFPSTPAGWTLLTANCTGAATTGIFYRVAAGGDANPDCVTAGNTRYAAVAARISGYGGAIEAGAVGSASNAAPNPLVVTPSWGSATTLWIEVVGTQAAVNMTVASAGYGSIVEVFPASGPSTAIASKNATASSDDPAGATLSSGTSWLAWTVAVKPLATVGRSAIIGIVG